MLNGIVEKSVSCFRGGYMFLRILNTNHLVFFLKQTHIRKHYNLKFRRILNIKRRWGERKYRNISGLRGQR